MLSPFILDEKLPVDAKQLITTIANKRNYIRIFFDVVTTKKGSKCSAVFFILDRNYCSKECESLVTVPKRIESNSVYRLSSCLPFQHLHGIK